MTGPPGLAFMGPSIGPCCYQVGEELAERFAERYGAGARQRDRRLDLWERRDAALAEIGVPRGRVINPRLCTVCHAELFYSHAPPRSRPAGAAAKGRYRAGWGARRDARI